MHLYAAREGNKAGSEWYKLIHVLYCLIPDALKKSFGCCILHTGFGLTVPFFLVFAVGGREGLFAEHLARITHTVSDLLLTSVRNAGLATESTCKKDA